MGWGSGSYLARQVWDSVKEHIPKKYKAKVAREIIRSFENEDCDTIQEAEELWNAAYERCDCFVPETYDFNESHEKCDGLGWVERK